MSKSWVYFQELFHCCSHALQCTTSKNDHKNLFPHKNLLQNREKVQQAWLQTETWDVNLYFPISFLPGPTKSKQSWQSGAVVNRENPQHLNEKCKIKLQKKEEGTVGASISCLSPWLLCMPWFYCHSHVPLCSWGSAVVGAGSAALPGLWAGQALPAGLAWGHSFKGSCWVPSMTDSQARCGSKIRIILLHLALFMIPTVPNIAVKHLAFWKSPPSQGQKM